MVLFAVNARKKVSGAMNIGAVPEIILRKGVGVLSRNRGSDPGVHPPWESIKETSARGE